MIKFKKLSVRNFLSIGDKPITIGLNHRGILFIGGWNEDDQTANGVGKTALFFDAILFVLFGEIRRGKADNIVNFKNGKNCEVELMLEYKGREYKIVRGRKPNKFYFYKDGEMIQHSSMKETQEALEEELNLSREVFNNLFFVNINHLTPLLLSTPIKVKEYFEKFFFGRLIFREIQKMARADKNDIWMKMVEVDTEIKSIEHAFEHEKRMIELQKEQFEKSKKSLVEVKNEIDRINEKIKELEKDIESRPDFEKLKESFQELQRVITICEMNIKTAKDKIKFITENEKCPTCGQKLTKTYKDKIHNAAQKELNINETKLNELNKKKEEIKNKIDELILLNNELNDLKIMLNTKTTHLKEIAARVKDLKQINESIKRSTSEIEKKLEELRKQFNELEKKHNVFEWIEEQFSEHGIIQWFIEYVRIQLNNIISHYTEVLNFPYYFQFDQSLQLTSNNIEFDGLSEGEKKLFNFILFFSMYDIFLARAGNYPSMIVFDELFDSALAEDRIEQVLRLIRELINKYNLSVFILSPLIISGYVSPK